MHVCNSVMYYSKSGAAVIHLLFRGRSWNWLASEDTYWRRTSRGERATSQTILIPLPYVSKTCLRWQTSKHSSTTSSRSTKADPCLFSIIPKHWYNWTPLLTAQLSRPSVETHDAYSIRGNIPHGIIKVQQTAWMFHVPLYSTMCHRLSLTGVVLQSVLLWMHQYRLVFVYSTHGSLCVRVCVCVACDDVIAVMKFKCICTTTVSLFLFFIIIFKVYLSYF